MVVGVSFSAALVAAAAGAFLVVAAVAALVGGIVAAIFRFPSGVVAGAGAADSL